MATQSEIAIEHVGGSSPPAFRLTRRADGKSLEAVPVASPYDFPLGVRAGTSLMKELRWYLEHFLDYPYPPETKLRKSIQVQLRFPLFARVANTHYCAGVILFLAHELPILLFVVANSLTQVSSSPRGQMLTSLTQPNGIPADA